MMSDISNGEVFPNVIRKLKFDEDDGERSEKALVIYERKGTSNFQSKEELQISELVKRISVNDENFHDDDESDKYELLEQIVDGSTLEEYQMIQEDYGSLSEEIFTFDFQTTIERRLEYYNLKKPEVFCEVIPTEISGKIEQSIELEKMDVDEKIEVVKYEEIAEMDVINQRKLPILMTSFWKKVSSYV
ncbi:hypothetical protein L6452_15064 [Arctium lappa]|uniref:Uncharacterized protein n=1 Tax=Arctium lappa TaxID=4217 RepID=A0ACB9CN03_ARCLA|nr:hypothetical protein L6452_15064 [Arctium lappa]